MEFPKFLMEAFCNNIVKVVYRRTKGRFLGNTKLNHDLQFRKICSNKHSQKFTCRTATGSV